MKIRYILKRIVFSKSIFFFILIIHFGESIFDFWPPYLNIHKEEKQNETFGCPVKIECDQRTPYREFDGKCNNLRNPLWGAAGIIFRRYIPSSYDDGIKVPRGKLKLPNPRQVTAALISTSVNECDGRLSVLHMEWGQFISHDITLTSTARGLTCCNIAKDATLDAECLPIDVTEDLFFKQFNVSCLQVTRSIPAASNCNKGPREQVNDLSSYLDGSVVYGISLSISKTLRTFSKGQMKTGEGAEAIYGECPASSSCPFSFMPTVIEDGQKNILAGESRATQQPALLSMHVLFIRVHNDLALRLSKIHPNYDDEKLFQEARRVVIAMIQHITYNEYLPSILSDEALFLYCIRPLAGGYLRAYDESVDASLFNAFAAAAFRFGHSQIPNTFNLTKGSIHIVQSFFDTDILATSGHYPSDFLNGISSQKAQVVDQNLVESVANRLFARGPSFQHGTDLFSRNIIRGRDHGLPSYTAFRRYCNLPDIKTFAQLKFIMKEDVVKVFESLYHSVDEIDLYPAAISEKPVSNGALGLTLTCLIGQQFRNLKFGDRFYYEGVSQPLMFSEDQLALIRRTTIASLLCRYTNTKEAPLKAMKYSADGMKTKCTDILKHTVLSDFDMHW